MKNQDVLQKVDKCIEVLESIKAELTPKDSKAKAEPEAPAHTLEEVRAVLADLSRRGFTTNVRLMLVGVGASKLSEVDPKDYAELLKKAEELNNGIKES